MNDFILFFENLPSSYKLIWVFICLSISWILEFISPLVHLAYHKWRHAGINLVFFSTSLLVNIVFGILTVGIFTWTATNQFGLLYLFDLPILVELLLSIMILDLVAQYAAHYLLHSIAWMWKFHIIHHSDTEVDATTGTRHHPGDYLIRELFAITVVFLMGMPISFYVIYRFTSIVFTYFTHSNIGLPLWLDKAISLVFVSPNMHKFHHHFERPWTDTNFGNIFSFWDRIFGTMVYGDPREVKYGLDVIEDEKSTDIPYQFGIPFNPNIKTD